RSRALFLRAAASAVLLRRCGRPHHVGLVRRAARLWPRAWLEVRDRHALVRPTRSARLSVEVACPGLRGLGARFRGCRFTRFTLRLRRGCVVLTVVGRNLFVRCESRGCCHLVRARGALACTATAAASSTTAPTAAATPAFGALGAAFRRRRWGGRSAGCVLRRPLGGAAGRRISA